MKTTRMKTISIGGRTGRLAEKIIDHWLLGLRETNPAILDMFAERDRLPYRDLLPWSGEFSGKYITGAYYIYRMTLDGRLYDYMIRFVDELITYQDTDGYLGCFSKKCHLTGRFSQHSESRWPGTWDSWSHYHNMFGLLLWYYETGNRQYREAVLRAAELFIQKFYNPETGNCSLLEMGDSEMNLGILHIFALLYTETGEQKYLDFAHHIENDLGQPEAGNYIQHALTGLEFWQCPKPRWESMHIILGIAELYRGTGDNKYLEAAYQIYNSILKTDVHNTGAFSTGERAVGNPFSRGPIETCCVIAYNALAVEIFKLTGDISILDHLELSHYNACMGLWSPSGRWSTYDTPMNGTKCASAHSINFQCRPGSPELNCCSVNAARSIGMLSEWVVCEEDAELYLNCFEEAVYETENGVRIIVNSQYPMEGPVRITIGKYTGKVHIRIPGWSRNTTVTAAGENWTPPAGSYLTVQCDQELELHLELDFTTRYLKGERDFEGSMSIFRGPLLFGTDTIWCGSEDLMQLPALNKEDIDRTAAILEKEAICIPLANGTTLCDFYHLGITGGEYMSWLPVQE